MSDDPVLSALFRLEAGMTGLQTSFATLETRQAALETSFASLEKRVLDLQEGQASLQAGQASLQAGQAAIEDRLSILERQQTNLRVAVMDRMDRLEDNLTAIREDISVNLGAITHDREALENTRGDMRSLRERVDLMWRQIKRLEQQVRDITGEP